jgi:OOP family OmpA-OmpF porin
VKKSIIITSLTAASLAFSASALQADADNPWHITGYAGGVDLAGTRDTRNDDVLWGVGFGRFFGNNLSLDLEYDQFKGTFRGHDAAVPGSTYDKWGLSNWGVMSRYHFTDKAFRPYLAFGLGGLKHRSVLDENTNMSVSYGLGLRGQMAKHVSLNAQILWRRDLDGSSQPAHGKYTDFIYTLGLSFDFGGRPAPTPAPAPAPEPAKPAPPPNPDLDGDGVLNERDKCPNTRPGAVVDLDGCEVEAVIELGGVHFDFDKATLKPEALTILDQAAALLNKHEKVVVEVAGHTDSKGSEEYNQGLSERRATAVKDYLNSKGVKASRLTARGYGELQPVASNDTDAGRAENRRVELIVLDR